ncbi:MAG: YjbF family lipoprotein [Alphaproteobacteria bacterium]
MRRLIATVAALALLAACGNEKSEPSPLGTAVSTLAKATVSRVAARRAGGEGKAPAPPSRADIEKYGMPILRAVIPSRGADALVTISDQKGPVVTWSTTDGTTFTLRDGVLIQTRGLGPDLMSAAAPGVSQLLRDGGSHQRVYYFLGQDDSTTRRTYDCTVDVKGRESITIFDRTHAVTRVTEECQRPQGKLTNDYWIEGSSIRKSRQWASGLTGHIDFERVVD